MSTGRKNGEHTRHHVRGAHPQVLPGTVSRDLPVEIQTVRWRPLESESIVRVYIYYVCDAIQPYGYGYVLDPFASVTCS